METNEDKFKKAMKLNDDELVVIMNKYIDSKGDELEYPYICLIELIRRFGKYVKDLNDVYYKLEYLIAERE